MTFAPAPTLRNLPVVSGRQDRPSGERPALAGERLLMWRRAQAAAWIAGAALFLALIFAPAVGLHLLWNVLIPVLPALLALAPGIWRNLCPLATTSLLPRHLGIGRKMRLPRRWEGRLSLLAVALLLAIVPLRRVLLDMSGPATALVLAALAAAAALAGLLFEWKSAWCAALCPVHPIERLYASAPLVTLENAHCDTCDRCVAACPDSTPHPNGSSSAAMTLTAGVFPGFVWGWFHVPDGMASLATAYGLPLGAGGITLIGFLWLRDALGPRRHRPLLRAFGTLALAVYYWYRIPALVGFGLFPGDGMLVDLRGALPSWGPLMAQELVAFVLLVWAVETSQARRPWLLRPPAAA